MSEGIEPATAPGEKVTRIETSTPLWRLVGVVCAAAAIAAVAYWLNAIHHGDDAATIAVITAGYTVTFWARKRPDRVERRFGPFGKIASAIRESQDDLREWVYDRPLRAGVMIAACYGLAVVLAKHLVLVVIDGLWSPWLAVAFGAAIGAVAAAPHMFASALRRVSG